MTRPHEHPEDYDDGELGEADQHLLDDDPIDMIPCPMCGKRIVAEARHCLYCEIEFGCEAWQVGESSRPIWRGGYMKLLIVLTLIAVLTGLIAMLF